jgi:hypothetical protein
MVRRLIAVWAILAALLLPARAGWAQEAVPSGFRVTAQESLAEGVQHLFIVRDDPPLAVHIARISPAAPVALRVVLSNEAVLGPEPRKELTSSMCVRVECILAVNGDFSVIETGEPLGAVVIGGELVRSPNEKHHQMTISSDSAVQAGPLEWSGTLMPTNLKPIQISGVNVARGDNQIVLYTSLYGPSTETNQYGSELIAEVVEPAGPLRLGTTARIKLLELRDGQGNTAIPKNAVVFSGHGPGADTLKALWSQVDAGKVAHDALIRLETTPEASESVGGTPVLVRDGKRWFADEPTSLVRDRHPRTLAGWNKEKWLWLVTVDGRQPGYSVGMTLAEASDFMIALGATEAINLDGGGSSTFVVRGRVLNQPSDRAVRRGTTETIVSQPQSGDRVIGNVERPRPVALALVPKVPVKDKGPQDVAPADLDLPKPVPIARPVPVADPASNPAGTLPSIVNPVASSSASLLVVALSMNATVFSFALVRLRRRLAFIERGS